VTDGVTSEHGVPDPAPEQEAPPGARGRPRNPRTHLAILRATSDLILDVGYDKLTMEGVAARAGVGKQTIYRWWPSKGALVSEAVLTGALPTSSVVLSDTGDLRVDLAAWLARQAMALGDPRSLWVVRAAAAAAADDERDAQQLYRRFTGPTHQALVTRMNAGIGTGEVRPDADVQAAADALLGALLYFALARHEPITVRRTRGLLDLVLSGIGTGQAFPRP
jgi:AcrR family transcriptional regulator